MTESQGHRHGAGTAPGSEAPRWIHADDEVLGAKRSLQLEVSARLLFPTILMVSLYLLFAGHSEPGGGFSGGLVAGLACTLRYIAGGRRELTTVMRVRPATLVGTGLAVVVATALAPIAFGAAPLSAATGELHLPVLGHIELTTSLLLDVGVYTLILGGVQELLRTLGAGIERKPRTEHERERRENR